MPGRQIVAAGTPLAAAEGLDASWVAGVAAGTTRMAAVEAGVQEAGVGHLRTKMTAEAAVGAAAGEAGCSGRVWQ